MSKKLLVLFLVCGLIMSIVGCGKKATSYLVSGQVLTAQGTGLAGVSLSFSGNAGVTETGADGKWSAQLTGTVTITPAKEGWTFDPPSIEVTQARNDLNFTATQKTYAISGTVTDSTGTGLEGVTIAFDGNFTAVTTAADGTWSKSGLTGTVKVTPSKEGWNFTPPSTEVSSATNQLNFTAVQSTYVISGKVVDSAGVALEGVSMVFNEGQFEAVSTSADGTWSKSGLSGTVAVTPSKQDWYFEPDKIEVTHTRTDLNFVGQRVTRSLAGTVTEPNGQPIADVLISFDEEGIQAVTTDANGNWSQDGFIQANIQVTPTKENWNFTPTSTIAAGGDQEVNFVGKPLGLYFPDDQLEQAIRTAIQKPTGPINPEDVANLTDLYADGLGISDLEGIQNLTNLGFLSLLANNITDITPVKDLPKLFGLHLGGNQIQDISVLAEMPTLENVALSNNPIQDISPLASLTKMWYLELQCTQITSIAVTANMPELTILYISETQVTDLSPLQNCPMLSMLYANTCSISNIAPLSNCDWMQYLYLTNNEITDLSPIAGMTKLRFVSFANNQIESIQAFKDLTSLQKIELQWNQIRDVQALVDNAGLGTGDYLDVRNNYLTLLDDGPLLLQLNERGVQVLYDPQR